MRTLWKTIIIYFNKIYWINLFFTFSIRKCGIMDLHRTNSHKPQTMALDKCSRSHLERSSWIVSAACTSKWWQNAINFPHVWLSFRQIIVPYALNYKTPFKFELYLDTHHSDTMFCCCCFIDKTEFLTMWRNQRVNVN